MKALIDIQQRLRAPKNKVNNFGKFNYRSCEDIMEAVKPLLAEHQALLYVTDNIEALNGKNYIVARATFIHEDFTVSVTGIAREGERKGMDDSQVSGSTSSYARKYALNGLFLIDDAKDPDSNEYRRQTTSQKAQPAADLAKALRDCKTIAQLQTAWSNIPIGEKPALEGLKNELKTKLK